MAAAPTTTRAERAIRSDPIPTFRLLPDTLAWSVRSSHCFSLEASFSWLAFCCFGERHEPSSNSAAAADGNRAAFIAGATLSRAVAAAERQIRWADTMKPLFV